MSGVCTLPSRQKILQSQSPFIIFSDFTLFCPLSPPFFNHRGQVRCEPIRTYSLITLLSPPFILRPIRARPFSRLTRLGHDAGGRCRVCFDAPWLLIYYYRDIILIPRIIIMSRHNFKPLHKICVFNIINTSTK